MYSKKEIDWALERAREFHEFAKFIEHYKGYIIVAENVFELADKKRKVDSRNTVGFYTVEALIAR